MDIRSTEKDGVVTVHRPLINGHEWRMERHHELTLIEFFNSRKFPEPGQESSLLCTGVGGCIEKAYEKVMDLRY